MMGAQFELHYRGTPTILPMCPSLDLKMKYALMEDLRKVETFR